MASGLTRPLLAEVVRLRFDANLRPRYDKDLDMLFLESAYVGAWPHGGTIDGILTLDLDPDRVLVHAEFGWARHRWPEGSAESALPDKLSRGSIRLPNFASASIDASYRVHASYVRGSLWIRIDARAPDEVVDLGDGVAALLGASDLTGLLVTRV